MRTRSPRSAPPEKGELGSTASTPMRRPRSRKAPTSAVVVVDLPTPGEPVRPMTHALPAWGASAAITSRSDSWPSSTREIRRATARGEPALADSTRAGTSTDRRATRRVSERSGGRGDADDEGVALTAAATEGGRADAATTTLQLEREVQGDAGTRHPDRVAERDGAAVDVDLVDVDPELLGRGEADGREGLVDLDEVEVGRRDALLLTGAGDSAGRLLLERRVGPGDHAVRADLGEPREAELLGLRLAHDDDGRRAVGD